ncbi:MFS transporter TsgA [Buchnera aphidicola (Thelaxes californica)]|uniref:MFS transporter TsgA n=1 Tax=Buchnera aphidicola (Thelaxes californica) TaxID=1315998 RepID=A0A4D6YP65_9GAMM|nr:MFS transporter TsgA [Buchnera aphidicola]QCI26935.1 MFS transporter TsgA [Buchnera aphidicola (Thelaxes californica)]
MKKKNKRNLTLISLISYFLTGSLITITGTILGNLSKYFNVPIAKISTTFTFLNIGILISMLMSILTIEKISIKTQLIISFLLTIFSIMNLFFCTKIQLFSVSMFIFGIVSGVTMSIGTYIITNLYQGTQRGKKLLLTDSCFSLAGMIIPIITTKIISHQYQWQWIYIIIGIIDCCIIIIALNTNFEIKKIINQNEKKKQKLITCKVWINIFLISISAFLYILGQLTLISWIPEYLMQTLNINIVQTGKIISIFWMFYMIGMWFFSFILKFFDLQKILVTLSGISSILIFTFIQFKNIYSLYINISLLGFFSSAIYTILITLASLQTKLPSLKLINIILISGTCGTVCTFIFTQPIIFIYGIKGALITGNILYTMVFIINIIIGYTSKHKMNY